MTYILKGQWYIQENWEMKGFLIYNTKANKNGHDFKKYSEKTQATFFRFFQHRVKTTIFIAKTPVKSTLKKLIFTGRVIGARILGPDGEVIGRGRMVGRWVHCWWCNDRQGLSHCYTKSEMPNISIVKEVKESSFAFQNRNFFMFHKNHQKTSSNQTIKGGSHLLFHWVLLYKCFIWPFLGLNFQVGN